MKTHTLITGIAVLFLATGAAHALTDEEIEAGTQYDCGSDHDSVAVIHEHVLSTTTRAIVAVTSDSYGGRYKKGKRTPYPIIQYNMETGVVTLNGKRCKEEKK